MTNTQLSQLNAYLEVNFQNKDYKTPWRPVVSLSRQTGAGGSIIAHKTAAILTQNGDKQAWIVMDDALADLVMEDNKMPERIKEFLSEKQSNAVTDMVEELIGIHHYCPVKSH